MKYIASVSFGKDSLAMLLMLIEKKWKLDEVVFYDTGMEFNAIYDIRDKVKTLLKEKNIKYTELKPAEPFLYKMLEKEVQKRDGTVQHGYGLCGGRCRWETTEKNKTIERYLKEQYGQDYKEFIGIAYDEEARIEKERNEHKLLPLADWKMTEQHCLEYCYNSGFYWEENGVRLYDILDRVSCWCCANKNKKELENMRKYLPNYYLKYIDLLKKIKENNKKRSYSRKSKGTIFKIILESRGRKMRTYKLFIRKYNLFKNDYEVVEKTVKTNDIYHEIGYIYSTTLEEIKRIDYVEVKEGE